MAMALVFVPLAILIVYVIKFRKDFNANNINKVIGVLVVLCILAVVLTLACGATGGN